MVYGLAADHLLRGHVVGGPRRNGLSGESFYRDAKVAELQVTVGIEQDIGRFYIAMHDPCAMGAGQCAEDLL